MDQPEKRTDGRKNRCGSRDSTTGQRGPAASDHGRDGRLVAAAAPDVVGRTLTLNDETWEVVGVTPRGFSHPLSATEPADPLAILSSVRSAIWSVNPRQRLLEDTVTLEAYMNRLVAQRRFNMALLSLFGVLGLFIAALGLYSLMAYTVAQRTSEIGLRMALGANRWIKQSSDATAG